MKRTITITTIVAVFMLIVSACHTTTPVHKEVTAPELIRTNLNGDGPMIEIQFFRGEEHNHPLIAAWVEDTNRKYIQTLFISESIATSIFDHSKNPAGKWEPGEVRRPAALPVWSHAYGYVSSDGYYLPDPQHKAPDAVTGPTPSADFKLEALTNKPLPSVIDVYLELNQSWDWNHYWNNHAFPGDKAYESSAQPSLIYRARIELNKIPVSMEMQIVGHGDFSGRDGLIYKETETMTTALEIAKKILVQIK